VRRIAIPERLNRDLAATPERARFARHGAGHLDEVRPMMASIFAVLLIAFVLNFSGARRLAVVCLFVSFALCVGLFLWEIYSPEYGFRMPWLQVELERAAAPIRSS
jgi:hypothetical protein